SRA
ncbi:50S ribosomal protein L11, partial [Escherichia coli 95.0183]